jgi:hypothetical protein
MGGGKLRLYEVRQLYQVDGEAGGNSALEAINIT